ncbi:RNA 2'-phosphotransferase [Paenibacillus selenitireducens]|uniref:Probable RNA 2'-phosphotransferase n=1 Tax=Paenibacillus selenitireducens TaxID=1324314 RepID=A0A1T2XCD5_9BACL|nr:RNA 2'-phosphotransferase [Paenibacillus selenitireducens]OPA77574.1 RNA 2'-phosphotransferase [Paenibacillus selenitireducens]
MLTKAQEQSLSKFMSKMLRHTPAEFGLVLDAYGYCQLEDLLHAIRKEHKWAHITEDDIETVVSNCEKQRYEIKGKGIRARYGHSAEKLTYQAMQPPAILYHGTNAKVVHQILAEGLKPMGRQYVHLSENIEFATLAGKRRGELVILEVDTAHAAQNGGTFYFAESGVWLADKIPAGCMRIHG